MKTSLSESAGRSAAGTIPPLALGITSSTLRASPSPRPTSARDSDLRSYQAKRYEGLARDGKLTQEVLQSASRIVEAAMMCGAVHARVQTLRLASNQFGFTYKQPWSESESYELLDAQSMQCVPQVRITLASSSRELVEWLVAQGLQCTFTVCRARNELVFGKPVLASWVNCVALFLPAEGGQEQGNKRALHTWNTVYMHKCLDTSAVPAWNARCANAMRMGAAHFAVCTLYRHADYGELDTSVFPPVPKELQCAEMRHHLTFDPALRAGSKAPIIALEEKFATLVSWVAQLGYAWTLTSSAYDAPWAYFVVLLDPLERYY